MKEKKCTECPKHFMPALGQKQCSPKCYYKSLGKKVYKVLSKKKPAYKPKENPIFLKNSRQLREKQIEDYNHTFCELCKKPGPVEAHHIVYRSEKPGYPELHSKKNLILLCHTHHEWMHENKQNRKQLVFDRKLNEIFGEDIIH